MGLLGLTLAHPEGGVLTDSRAYLEVADGILRFGPLGDPEATELHRTSAYPLFLALVQTLTRTSLLGVVVIQLLFGAIGCFLLVRIGHLLGVPQGGMLAAYLYALSPNTAMWSLTVMSETLFALLLVTALWTWLRSLAGGRVAWLLATGVVLGLASLVRPIGLPVIGLWAVTELWLGWQAKAGLSPLARVTVMVCGLGLVLAPWSVRNRITYGDAGLSRIPWAAFVRFNLAYAVAAAEGIGRNEAAVALEAHVDSWPEAWAIIRAYPGEFVEQQVRGILRSSLGVESGAWARIVGLELEDQGSFGILGHVLAGRFPQAWAETRDLLRGTRGTLLILGALALIHSLACYAAAARAGRPSSRPAMTRGVILCLALTAAFLLIAPGAAGQARFRIAVEPVLALLAGVGAVRWRGALGTRDARAEGEQ